MLHVDHNTIVARVEAAFAKSDVVAYHSLVGPKEHELEKASRAWADLQGVVDRRPQPHYPLVSLADANGRLGSVTSQAVGSRGKEEETFNGSEYRRFLEQNNLFAPATFSRFQCGDDDTWAAASGTLHRID